MVLILTGFVLPVLLCPLAYAFDGNTESHTRRKDARALQFVALVQQPLPAELQELRAGAEAEIETDTIGFLELRLDMVVMQRVQNLLACKSIAGNTLVDRHAPSLVTDESEHTITQAK